MPDRTRRIFKSRTSSQSEVRELLEFVFVGEILDPGQELWLVSPWISDVILLDNRAGSFNMVDPEWGPRELRLSDLLLTLMKKGQVINIVTSGDTHNQAFFGAMDEKVALAGLQQQFWSDRNRRYLHTKGMLTERGHLSGSMNFTYNGIELNDETVTFEVAPRDVALARLNYENYRHD